MEEGNKQFALVLVAVVVGLACIGLSFVVKTADQKIELVGTGMWLLGWAKKRPWDHAAELHPADIEKKLTPVTAEVVS